VRFNDGDVGETHPGGGLRWYGVGVNRLTRALVAVAAAVGVATCAVTTRDVVAVDLRCERACDGALLDALSPSLEGRSHRRDRDRLRFELTREELAPLARLDADVERLRAVRGDLDLAAGAAGYVDLVFASYPAANGVALKLRWATRLLAPRAVSRGLTFTALGERVRVGVALDPDGLDAALALVAPWLPR